MHYILNILSIKSLIMAKCQICGKNRPRTSVDNGFGKKFMMCAECKVEDAEAKEHLWGDNGVFNKDNTFVCHSCSKCGKDIEGDTWEGEYSWCKECVPPDDHSSK